MSSTSSKSSAIPLETAIATRTLIAGGFTITAFQGHPDRLEYECERADLFGITIRYLVALFFSTPIPSRLEHLTRRAQTLGRVLIAVGSEEGPQWLSWANFLAALGGAVPSWRALSSEFPAILQTTAQNALPPGEEGEPWQLFEEATADGLEFLFGWRVQRLGGRRRGSDVVDLVAHTPDRRILVLDTKASAMAFSVGMPQLRPLQDYVRRQAVRQEGLADVGAAVLIAASFAQSPERLNELSGSFLAEARIPLTFLTTDVFCAMVEELRCRSHLRNRIRWNRIFCSGGLVTLRRFQEEVAAAEDESYSLR